MRKGAHDGAIPALVEGLGYVVVRGEGDGAGGDGLPVAFLWCEEAFAAERRSHAAFASGVGQLDTGADALRVNEGRDLLEPGDVLVFPDAEVGGGDAAFRQNGGSLDHDEAGASLRAGAEVDEMPVGGESIVGGVLAHGRDADAVGESDRTKLQGRKKRLAHEDSVQYPDGD